MSTPGMPRLLNANATVPGRPLIEVRPCRLAPGQVDAQLLSRSKHVLVGLPHLDLLTFGREHLDVQAEGLHLLDDDLEGLRDPRLGDVLALDDGLLPLDPPEHIAVLDGEPLL